MGWTKLYKNNAVLTEPESWSRTPLDNMVGAELRHNDMLIAIYGNGTYWQSDTFETDIVPYGAPPQRLVSRRIEKYINNLSFAKIHKDNFGLSFDFRDQSIQFDSCFIPNKTIWISNEKELPMWLIVQLDPINKKTMFYTSKEKI